MTTKHGYKLEEWETAKEEMRQILIGQAKQGRTIPYSDLAAQIKTIKLPRNSPDWWNMLGEISTKEDAAGRGMLTVLVVHGQGDTLPGAGFFKLARRLGRDVSDERDFWLEELERVYRCWSTGEAMEHTAGQESHGRVAADQGQSLEARQQHPDSNTSMTIPYPTRSEFIDTLREGVNLGRSRLEEGHSIEVALKPGGYQGKWSVIIHPDDSKEFTVVGTMKDPTRFPQRIRVAAWALFEERTYGRFVIELDRESGIVTIEREDDGNQGTTTSTGGEQGRGTSGEVLVIVPCGHNKVWDSDPQRGSVQAKDAYTSLFFMTNRAYAEKIGSRWVILSAKYGFIRPDFQIPGSYNVSFKDPLTKPVEAPTLIDQIKGLGLGEAQRVIGLGGREYRAMIKEAFAAFGCPVIFPFAGLPIGEIIQATKGAIEMGKFSG